MTSRFDFEVACDACGVSRAQTLAVLPNDRVLKFCGHHTHVNEAALLAQGAVLTPIEEEVDVPVPSD